MNRQLVSVKAIKAVRVLRGGVSAQDVSNDLGLAVRDIQEFATSYEGVSDFLLARLERLLKDREKLKQMIATLMLTSSDA